MNLVHTAGGGERRSFLFLVATCNRTSWSATEAARHLDEAILKRTAHNFH